MFNRNPFALNSSAPFTDDERRRLQLGENILKKFGIKWDAKTRMYVCKTINLGNNTNYVKFSANSNRSAHFRQTKTRESRAFPDLREALFGAGDSIYCQDKWAAVFYTSTLTTVGTMPIPHALIAEWWMDPEQQVLSHLLEAGKLSPDFRGGNGVTLLMTAANYENLPAAKLLLEVGADLNAVASPVDASMTAIDFARRNDGSRVLPLLLSWQAKIAMQDMLAQLDRGSRPR